MLILYFAYQTQSVMEQKNRRLDYEKPALSLKPSLAISLGIQRRAGVYASQTGTSGTQFLPGRGRPPPLPLPGKNCVPELSETAVLGRSAVVYLC